MAIATIYTYLMYYRKDASPSMTAWTKLMDIKSYPDLGSSPNMIETTTLSNGTQTFVLGVKQVGDGLEFSANFEKADYKKIQDMADEEVWFAIWFGRDTTNDTPKGQNGIFEFRGKIIPGVSGGGVDEAVEMTLTIAPDTDIKYKETSTEVTSLPWDTAATGW